MKYKVIDYRQNRVIKHRQTGAKKFILGGKDQQTNVLSFWQWAHSDLMGNTLRGILAEYIVAVALGADQGVREEWDAFDITTPECLKIEVKSSAYLQSWDQKQPSRIIFDIEPKQAWQSNNTRGEAKRHADIYVFCLFAHQKRETANPLNLDQWEFYIAPSHDLDVKLGLQKKISLGALKKFCGNAISYGHLAESIAIHSPILQNGKSG